MYVCVWNQVGKKKDLTEFKKRVAENFLFFISSVFLKTHVLNSTKSIDGT